MEYPNNPHDRFFKKNMGDIEIALDFVQICIPKELTEKMDLSTLSIQKESFVHSDFREYFSDVLYRVQMSGRESYLYLLFEHKSYPYADITLQLLSYMVNIYQYHRVQEKKKKLPVILPIVFYHGREKWNIPENFSALFEEYGNIWEDIERYVPDFRYILYDTGCYNEKELEGKISLQIALRTLKYIFVRDEELFLQTVMETVRLIEMLPDSGYRRYRFEQVVQYIFYARQDVDLEKMEKKMEEISKERSEQLMSIAEKLMKRGWEEGWEEGREEGREESLIQIAKNMLRMGSEIPFIVRATGLSEERIIAIQKEME